MGPINGQTDIVLGFGRYRGLSLSQIWEHTEIGDDGKLKCRGTSYVYWLAVAGHNPNIRKSAAAFIARKKNEDEAPPLPLEEDQTDFEPEWARHFLGENER